MKMLLTRIGRHSKLAVTGDLNQTDRPKDNGLSDFIEKLNKRASKLIDIVSFAKKDVLRHKAVQEVLDIYGDWTTLTSWFLRIIWKPKGVQQIPLVSPGCNPSR